MKFPGLLAQASGATSIVAAAALIGIGSPAGAAEATGQIESAAPATASVTAPKLGCGPACGYIHHSGDSGYNRAFTIRCDGYTTNHYVEELHSSTEFCHDTGKIYVHDDEQIVCLGGSGWFIKWDSTGWHDVTNLDNFSCVAERD